MAVAMKRLWRAWQFFQTDWPLLAGALGLLLLSTWANLLKPWPLALIVDSVFGAKPLPSWLGAWDTGADKAGLVLVLAGVVLALQAGQGVISTAQNHLTIRIGLQGLRRVRNEVFSRLQRLSLRFHQGAQSGDTIYRASWDTYAFQTLFQQGFVTFCTASLTLAMMVGVMWRLNERLTLVAAGVAPLLVVVIRVFGRQMRERGAEAQAADSRVTALVQQCLTLLPLIQSDTRESREEARFTAQTAVAQSKRLAQHRWELLYWLAISVVFALGTAALVWCGSREVLAGKLSVGRFLIFLAYLSQWYDPLNQLSHVGATVSHAGAGMQRVFEILDTPEEVRDASEARPIVESAAPGAGPGAPSHRALPRTRAPAAITFEAVCFAYQSEQPVLREVSFSLGAGECAAIIGPSGAGKTTLLQLLPRFYDPTRGSIRLDGIDLRQLWLGDLRRQVALVMQEPLLLADTIAENIACARPDATLAQIEAAARAAQAEGFIQKLPQRYDTVVGEGAARLSAGEKQRLSLARAFLKDAPLLVLDEPTSALDAESAGLVAASLAELMRGRTTLLVTHRLASVRQADRILVLDQGRLVEMGRPDELLRNPQSYYARAAAA
jgi:ATP-binding cassette subfamily B protein/subfamily B ATP-binding cassette protein MsbA